MAPKFKTRHYRSSNALFHIGALIAVTAWGASFISTKVLLQNELNPVEIYVYRSLIAYLLTLLVCPRPFFSNSIKDELLFVLCGICGGSIYFIAENTAVGYTLVTNVALITSLAPLLTAMCIGLVYKNERPAKGIFIGSVIALLGVACVIFNSSFVVKVNPLGDLLSLLAAVCWTVYCLLLRPLNAIYSTWFITRKTFFYGILTAIPFLMMEGTLAPLSVMCRPEVIGNLAFLGIIASMAAYLLWAQTIKRLGAVKAGNYLYFSPIVTLILSVWLLNEKISIIGFIGCVMIILGVILGEKLSKRRESTLSPR